MKQTVERKGAQKVRPEKQAQVAEIREILSRAELLHP